MFTCRRWVLDSHNLVKSIVSKQKTSHISLSSVCTKRSIQIIKCPATNPKYSTFFSKAGLCISPWLQSCRHFVSNTSNSQNIFSRKSWLLLSNFKHNGQKPRILFRFISSSRRKSTDERNQSALLYISAVGVFMIGMGYAGVPLYRMFCQATGLGGQAELDKKNVDKVESMSRVKERVIEVRFNADTASSMQWNFKPLQTDIKVAPGETALAFYTAKNPTDKPIIGISTYNVIPFEAGQYFNKIQCFCFEEQRLNPHEQVDMPVFFYIDPEYAEDPKLQGVDSIMLSYTFFEAKDGLNLPLPGYMQQNKQTL